MTLPELWYCGEVDLTAVPLEELIDEIDIHMPRDSMFSGHQNLCALWEEYRSRIESNTAVGTSGSIGILPGGFFARLLQGDRSRGPKR